MTTSDAEQLREQAHDAHGRRDWSLSLQLLRAAQREAGTLPADDWELLSDAAWWLGLVDESLEAAERAYDGHLGEGQPRRAALVGLGAAISLFLRGDEAIASGWLSRVQRLLDGQPEGAEHGYVHYFTAVEAGLQAGDLDGVVEAAQQVRAIGDRHGDPNLVAAGVLGEGRARVKRGEMERGMALLDEAMVTVLSGRLAPEWAGNVYCHLMAACHELGDIRRADKWTAATERWLASLPAAVLFTGICRVHRSQVLQVVGDWGRAEREAARVCEDLVGIHVASAAEAHYQLGELRRLRGDLAGAEDAYQRAREMGRDPQPGHALLCLARGRLDAAAAAIGAALLTVPDDPLARAPLCRAQVEIALEAGDLATARRACDELASTAATYGTSGLEVAALDARGAVLLADGHPEQALPALRAACRRWHELRAVHDAGRVRVHLARAYQELGDHDAARAELDAAAEAFAQLGAALDAREVARLRGERVLPAGLTSREAEVLALVATGRTNRQIAAALVLSEKTVARHLSNIFTKIDVTTRTEAAAFAYEHGLTGGRG